MPVTSKEQPRTAGVGRPVSRAAARSRRRSLDSSRRRRREGTPWFSYVVLTISVLLALIPLYWMFVVGSNDTSAVSRFPPVFLPGGNFLHNLGVVDSIVPFGRSLINSAIVSGAVALLQMFFCSLAGFAFAKLRFRGRRLLFLLVIATMALPSQLGLVPMYLIMSKLSWIDTYWALVVPGAVSAFGVFWMRQVVIGTIPDELIDAAKSDGCSTFRIYRSIVVPNIRGSAAVFGLFVAMTTWNDFLWPLVVLNTPDMFTSQVAIQQLRTQYTIDYSTVMTASVLATLPLLLLFVAAGKQLVAGIMEGAVKG
ncbi:carbohydrate ABC transporter permease [Streptomyces iranensis]|uniref:Cellobiose transport system permease protein n=1 Tax=Streptomyces iranensis TaxID=576784 RepID=A0A060ZAU9_9ACTN|nr:carbohydrate ABC transporter permease [Streptomyces iranensis]MBP2068497.1 cellobiose transport system permease protein [Streptomyces iranensis]CDR01203.1 sugar ABC transporter permease [Streptomyces iranensis]